MAVGASASARAAEEGAPRARAAIVEARAICKTYDTGAVRVDALRGVDLALGAGEMVAIMGPSGCGKTTLLNCLSGLDSIDGGEVLIEGTPLSEMSDAARTDYRARRMGFVFQFYNLMPVLTAVENVELPLLRRARRRRRRRGDGARGARARRARASARDHVPDELSGGQRQRVTIARALVNDPAIVWADEPTGDLDSENAEEIVELMRRLNLERGLTFLIVTHDIARRPEDRSHRAHGRRPDRRGATTGGGHMYSRVTLLEIDTLRHDGRRGRPAVRRARRSRAARAGGLRGRRTCWRTPRARGMILSVWETEEAAEPAAGALRHRGAREVRHDLPLAAGPRALRRRARRDAGRRPVAIADERALRHPGRHAARRPRRSRSPLALGVVGVLALRNRIFLKLGVRNVGRRRGRTALIVVGLMLGTTIIAAALATGDTMSHTIRATAVDALGETDEIVAARGRVDDIPGALGGARPAPATSPRERSTGCESALRRLRARRRRHPRDRRAGRGAGRRAAADRAAGDALRDRPGAHGRLRADRRRGRHDVSLADLRPRRGLPATARRPTKLARRGRRSRRSSSRRRAGSARVRDGRPLRRGGAPPTPALLMPLAPAQRLLGKPGQIRAVFVSNRGGATAGATLSDQVASAAPAGRRPARARGRQTPSRTRSSRPTRPEPRSCRSSRRSARSRSPPGSCSSS